MRSPSACSASYGTQKDDSEAKTKEKHEKVDPCVRLRAETVVEKRQPRMNANCFISVDRLSIILMLMDIRSTFDAPQPEDSLAVYLS